MSEKKFSFIEPLTKKPKVLKERRGVVSTAEQIVTEFKESGSKYAKVGFAKLKPTYQSAKSSARAVGRVIKNMELEETIRAYADEENLYLERLK